MRPRSVQFACMLALLCAFGAADAAVRAGQDCRDCAPLRILFLQVAAVNQASSSVGTAQAPQPTAATEFAEYAQADIPWAMRPPAAHSAQQHAVTATARR